MNSPGYITRVRREAVPSSRGQSGTGVAARHERSSRPPQFGYLGCEFRNALFEHSEPILAFCRYRSTMPQPLLDEPQVVPAPAVAVGRMLHGHPVSDAQLDPAL
jgi:hypothetical protein